MILNLAKDIYASRDLLWAMTYRDIRVKYKQAVMGILWAFFLPIMAIASGLIFRLAMALLSGGPISTHDIVAVMIKSLCWVLFAGIVGGASNSLIANMTLITKIYFPRQVVPLASLLSSLFDFVVSLLGLILILLAVCYFAQDPVPPIVFSWALLWVPLLVVLLVILAAGLGLFLSCANVFFRDVKYIVQVLLQFGVFFSLVFFNYEELGPWGWVLLLNPVAPLLEGLRTSVTQGAVTPDLLPWVGYSAAVAVLGFFVSCLVFDRAESLFADYV